MLSYLIFGITYAFAAAVQPGPLQTYLISQTVEKGWRSTLPAAFSPVISDIPISITILFLLSNLQDNFIIFLRIGGGLFLIFLAYKAFQSWQKYDSDKAVTAASGKQTLFRAVVVNLLNPHPYLGWSLIMGPLFLEGWEKNPANGLALIGGFYFTLMLMLVGIILLFGFASKLGPKVSKVMIGLSSLALFLFGIYQLWIGIDVLAFV